MFDAIGEQRRQRQPDLVMAQEEGGLRPFPDVGQITSGIREYLISAIVRIPSGEVQN